MHSLSMNMLSMNIWVHLSQPVLPCAALIWNIFGVTPNIPKKVNKNAHNVGQHIRNKALLIIVSKLNSRLSISQHCDEETLFYHVFVNNFVNAREIFSDDVQHSTNTLIIDQCDNFKLPSWYFIEICYMAHHSQNSIILVCSYMIDAHAE